MIFNKRFAIGVIEGVRWHISWVCITQLIFASPSSDENSYPLVCDFGVFGGLRILPRGIKGPHKHDGSYTCFDSWSASQTTVRVSVQMSAPVTKVLTPIEGRVVPVPSDEALDEKIHLDTKATEILKGDDLVIVTQTKSESNDDDSDSGADDAIIVTGADAAKHLLPLRDDLEPALTFRSLFLATILSAFQAVMHQIYVVSTIR